MRYLLHFIAKCLELAMPAGHERGPDLSPVLALSSNIKAASLQCSTCMLCSLQALSLPLKSTVHVASMHDLQGGRTMSQWGGAGSPAQPAAVAATAFFSRSGHLRLHRIALGHGSKQARSGWL